MPRTGKRPTVRLMMAMTADGKIATVAREAARFGSQEDQRRLREQVAWADALIVAAGTLRAHGSTFTVSRPDLVAQREVRGQRPQPTSVVVTRSLDLPLDIPFFTGQRIPRMIATTAPNERRARERFAGLAEVFAAGGRDVDVGALVRGLAERGMEHLLGLGGGELNYALVAAGLLDEVFLTVSPYFFGGTNAPTIIDGPGFAVEEAVKLVLVSCDAVDGEVFLHYRVTAR